MKLLCIRLLLLLILLLVLLLLFFIYCKDKWHSSGAHHWGLKTVDVVKGGKYQTGMAVISHLSGIHSMWCRKLFLQWVGLGFCVPVLDKKTHLNELTCLIIGCSHDKTALFSPWSVEPHPVQWVWGQVLQSDSGTDTDGEGFWTLTLSLGHSPVLPSWPWEQDWLQCELFFPREQIGSSFWCCTVVYWVSRAGACFLQSWITCRADTECWVHTDEVCSIPRCAAFPGVQHSQMSSIPGCAEFPGVWEGAGHCFMPFRCSSLFVSPPHVAEAWKESSECFWSVTKSVWGDACPLPKVRLDLLAFCLSFC